MNMLNTNTVKLFIFVSFFICIYSAKGQTKVALTIDDVPNTRKYERDNFNATLLNRLDSLSIPITIFINEGAIYKTDSVTKNSELLRKWIQTELVFPANHSFSHSRYSDVGLDSFKVDVIKGEYLTKELIKGVNKELNYFRFPFNDLGKDSIQQKEIEIFLDSKGYKIAPFTIESSDWMFNYIYKFYLTSGDTIKANEIGKLYIDMTIQYFDFFDSLATKQYGRSISQIYLCHDNSLNADYLPQLIEILKTKKYQFISLVEAMDDPVYKQPNKYYEKWGVSWVYRWVANSKKRTQLMQKEPNIDNIYKLYNTLTQIK